MQHSGPQGQFDWAAVEFDWDLRRRGQGVVVQMKILLLIVKQMAK